LSFIQTFFIGRYALQLMLIAVLLMLALALQVAYNPFDIKFLNKIERVSLITSSILYTATLGMNKQSFAGFIRGVPRYVTVC